MKRLFLMVLLASLTTMTAKEPSKRSWLPAWFNKKFGLVIPAKSLLDSEISKKSLICAGVGVSAAFATAAYFVVQNYFPIKR